MTGPDDKDLRRRNIRLALVLGALALVFYVAFAWLKLGEAGL